MSKRGWSLVVLSVWLGLFVRCNNFIVYGETLLEKATF